MSTETTMKTETNKVFTFNKIEASPLSKNVGEELFTVPELDDAGFSSAILVNVRGGEPRIEKVVGFALSLAQIDSQNAGSLMNLATNGEVMNLDAVNLDMYTAEGLEHANEIGTDPKPSASVRLDYASADANQIRVKAGIGLPVPTVADATGRNRRSQFPDWPKLQELGSNIDEPFLRRVAMAAFQELAKKDASLVKRMVMAMQPEEQAPKPAESTAQAPSSLAGLAQTEL